MQRTSLELVSKQTMATPLTDFTFPDSQWETDMASIQKYQIFVKYTSHGSTAL